MSRNRVRALAAEFEKPPEPPENRLSGRIQTRGVHIDGIGRVVVKHYFRGGILRHVNRRTYLKSGKTRCESEFDTLLQVRTIGVNAPEPVAFAYRTKTRIFYHAWLATREIPGAARLSDVARAAPSRAKAVLPVLEKQINLLRWHGILHVDLHPGNVLVDTADRMYIIDFDRAKTGIQNRARLARHYMNRWQRAVAKHGLPDFLSNLVVG